MCASVTDSQKKAASAVVVGCGGNIGSHIVGHLGRMPHIGRVVLIDNQSYEDKNRQSQDITSDEVGMDKATVQARKLRRINPPLEVTAINDDVENVPLARLRCDVILAGLDSLAARQRVNQVAWRLGVPWIDAGVQADGFLARVNVYVPDPDACCLECAWSPAHYDLLEQSYPCEPDMRVPPTNASSGLGALAASLQVIECDKILSGNWNCAAVGRQVLIDCLHHNHYVSTFTRNPKCRFDHEIWEIWSIEEISSCPDEIPVRQVFEQARRATGEEGPVALLLEGDVFVRKLTCWNCGAARKHLRLRRRLTAKQQYVCPKCGGEMAAGGADMFERLIEDQLSSKELETPLASLGFRSGDVLTVSGEAGEIHYEIGGIDDGR